LSVVGICHYKVGDTDGVSLEIDKWAQVLHRMGHEVHLCAGALKGTSGFLIDELYHHREDIERITRNAFSEFADYESEADFEAEILVLSDRIARGLRSFIGRFSIDLLVVDNIWSIGVNLPAAIAFARVVRECGIPAVAHHHDFYWETFREMIPTCEVARMFAGDYLPPKHPLIIHVVINSLAREELRRRDGVESSVIPNVFDFAAGSWTVDSYNRGFRRAIGVSENDVVVLQATRVVERKGIELAIDFVKELGEPSNSMKLQRAGLYDGRRFDRESRIVLVLAGYVEDGSEDYFLRLRRKIERERIETRFISDRIHSQRGEIDGLRVYSLWDCYTIADLVTYPSLFEGWGNQFLEAICARLPIAVFEYPVYREDIKGQGFEAISIGREVDGTDDLGLVSVSEGTIRQAAQKAIGVLIDLSSRQAMVDHNFRLGKNLYSLEILERYLTDTVGPVLGKPNSKP